ncbi:MAG TPA: ABC transporter ATP-binding protein [Firmicutes bacterium]|nr:ABC transporter ATP-binding protein [Bacillota bacterium]
MGRRLFSYVRPYWPCLLLGAITSLVSVAAKSLLPLVVGTQLVDQVLILQQDLGLLSRVMLVGMGIYLIMGVFFYLQYWMFSYCGHRATVDLRQQVYNKLQDLPLAYHEKHRSGELISRVINDTAMVQNALSVGIGDFLHNAAMVLGVFVLAIYINWRLFLLTLAILPLIAVAVSAYSKRIRQYSRAVQDRVADIGGLAQETLSGIKVVKGFAMEEAEKERFQRGNEQSFQATMKAVRLMASVVPIVELMMVSGLLLLIWYGAREVLQGRLSPGELVAFLSYIAMASGPVNVLLRTNNLFQQSLGAASRIFEVLDTPITIMEPKDPVILSKVKGNVEFEQVCFSYHDDEPVLKKVNLSVSPGDVTALVGPSGAGKTTLVNLIPRFYDPTSGAIRLDGHDLRTLSLRWLRCQVGIVPQDTVLFSGTIAENIAYGKPDATWREIQEAAKAANAHSFITSFPDGYDTYVGERGVCLSGGQRQRIAIARALLKQPHILILDEATSALDAESEYLVQEALGRLMEGRTTFVIAHRLSTIINATKILVLDAGRIVEQGSHTELMRRMGLYQRLYSTQFAG